MWGRKGDKGGPCCCRRLGNGEKEEKKGTGSKIEKGVMKSGGTHYHKYVHICAYLGNPVNRLPFFPPAILALSSAERASPTQGACRK